MGAACGRRGRTIETVREHEAALPAQGHDAAGEGYLLFGFLKRLEFRDTIRDRNVALGAGRIPFHPRRLQDLKFLQTLRPDILFAHADNNSTNLAPYIRCTSGHRSL